MHRTGPIIVAVAASISSLPLGAQPYPGWEGPVHRPDVGRIQVATFIAASPGVSELGHGPVVIAPPTETITGGIEDASYETALVSQLARLGYEPGGGPGTGGQTAEFTVSHDVIQPPEPPHSPVSGEVAVGGGNRGSGLGVALAIDLSKPLGALVSTRLEVRIRDRATKELLWQGRAEVLSREGDKHWKNEDVAAKLTAAMFRGFPRPQAN